MEYRLVTELNNDLIHEGTEEECQMILGKFVTYGILARKFIIEVSVSDDKRVLVLNEKRGVVAVFMDETDADDYVDYKNNQGCKLEAEWIKTEDIHEYM